MNPPAGYFGTASHALLLKFSLRDMTNLLSKLPNHHKSCPQPLRHEAAFYMAIEYK